MENTNISAGMGNTRAYGASSPATAPVMSVKDWIIASIIVAIPVVGFIMLFVWAFGDGTNPNKANWAKASLLFLLIAMIFGFLIFSIVGGMALFSMSEGF